MISKEDFIQKDRLIKGISTNGHFKISVVKTTDVVKAARQKHGLSMLNTVLLGRALTATMLLSSELKGEERIQLRLEGNGPVRLLVAEANRVGEVRGYAQNPEATLTYGNDDTRLEDGLGVGVLTVRKILYNEAEPKTSSIELAKGNVTDDIAYYMLQSEQVPSAVLLDVSIDEKGAITEAGGILIQRMPGAPEGVIEELQQKMLHFDSISHLLADGEYIDDIMIKAADPLNVKELDRQPVDFFCRCSRDRFVNALAMLGPEDLREIRDEGQELVCHFCNEHYHVSQQQIEELFKQKKAKMN
ncbi:MAG TPA: Hsp33 family molecular chaperone HslO [Fodinibius sp.]|nr:Hsp33 family molecular chaperone HslO [Fodinibius sp.]